jgi:hypothetical protein
VVRRGAQVTAELSLKVMLCGKDVLGEAQQEDVVGKADGEHFGMLATVLRDSQEAGRLQACACIDVISCCVEWKF